MNILNVGLVISLKHHTKKTNVVILYSMVGGVGKNAITDALCKLFKNYSGHI